MTMTTNQALETIKKSNPEAWETLRTAMNFAERTKKLYLGLLDEATLRMEKDERIDITLRRVEGLQDILFGGIPGEY